MTNQNTTLTHTPQRQPLFYFVMCNAHAHAHTSTLFNEVLFCVFNFRFINAMFSVSLDGVQWFMFCDMYLSGAVHFVDTELTEKPLIQSGCGKFHVCAVKFIDCIVLYLAGRDVFFFRQFDLCCFSLCVCVYTFFRSLLLLLFLFVECIVVCREYTLNKSIVITSVTIGCDQNQTNINYLHRFQIILNTYTHRQSWGYCDDDQYIFGSFILFFCFLFFFLSENIR